MKHYAIGDVHGEFDTLIELTSKLPKDAKFIFVGDLIDRGPDSKKVVEFVRKGNHQSVLGNHEDMMIEQAKRMKVKRENYTITDLWAHNGGLSTLESYGIIKMETKNSFSYTKDEASIDKFLDDAAWMATLPLLISAPVGWKNKYDIVVSHAAMGEIIWHSTGREQDDPKLLKYREHILWNREQRGAYPEFQMFNIFGHTPQEDTMYFDIDVSIIPSKNWINIDSGCTYNRPGLGKLTAFSLEDMESITEERV